MIDWRLAYRWTRDILAIFGAIGCSLALLVIALVSASAYSTGEGPAASTPARDPLAGAESLLDEAGVEREKQELVVLGYNSGEWLPSDDSHVQLWCLRAPGLRLGKRWLRPGDMAPMFLLSTATTVDAMHRAHACVPSWPDALSRGLFVQPIQFVYSQRDLGYARLGLYDREHEMLYLLARSVPTPGPAPAPSGDPGSYGVAPMPPD